MTDVRRLVDPGIIKRVIDAKENVVVPKKVVEEEPEQIIIEERIVREEGEYVKKYLRGKFLGKV